MAKRFEYNIALLPITDEDDLIDSMNDLGEQGWQLLFVFGQAGGALRGWFMRETSGADN